MVRTLSIIVSLLIGPSTVHAQADWDWRACEDGRDPVAAIAACTRLIDGGIPGISVLPPPFIVVGSTLPTWLRSIGRLRTSPDRSKSNHYIPALTMGAGMLIT